MVFQPHIRMEPELDGTVRVNRPPAGQEPQRRFCTQCGQLCDGEQPICTACQAVAAVAAASAAAVPAEEEQKPQKQKKSKAIPILLAIIILCLLLLGALVGYVWSNDLLPFGDSNDAAGQSEQADRDDPDEEVKEETDETAENEAAEEGTDRKEPGTEKNETVNETAPEETHASDSAPAGEEAAAADTPAEQVPDSDYAGEVAVDVNGMCEEMREDPLLFFLENCDCMYFTWDDLVEMGMDADECRLARNGIYARSGRIFQDESLSIYYSQFGWYKPTISAADFQEYMLNEYQIANRDLIIQYETAMGYR